MPSSVIDIEDVKAIASCACNNNESIEVIEYYLEPYSKNKIGFLGNHQKLEITVKLKNDSDKVIKLNFFAKSVPSDSEGQADFVKQRRVFSQEAEFFNEVMPLFLESTAAGDIEQWAPKCYLANQDIVVLEDLSTKGFAMHSVNILKGDILKAAVKAMARLHAASLLTEKRLGEPLNQLFPEACIEKVFHGHLRKQGLNLFEGLIMEIGKKHGKSTEKVSDVVDRVFDFVNNGKGKHKVMCHGDCWPNNVMLDSSDPPKCILVDYQIVRYATRMVDVAQLIYLSTTREIRNDEEKETIEVYWNELCETMRKCDPSMDRPSLENILTEYEEVRLIGQLVAVIYFPVILLNKSIFTEYEDDSELLYRKFVFRHNNDCVFELMEKDEEYSKRIVETILEFIEYCEILGPADGENTL